jgi:hypothetical protein
MLKEKQLWPSWRYGPEGQAEIFQHAGDVPRGWEDHPNKFSAPPAPAKKRKRKSPVEEVEEILTREEALEILLSKGIDMSDNTDAEIEAALAHLED